MKLPTRETQVNDMILKEVYHKGNWYPEQSIGGQMAQLNADFMNLLNELLNELKRIFGIIK